MVCGRLARRIAWVMFEKVIRSRKYLFTLPKPLFHLFCNLVNIVPEGSVRSGPGGLHRSNVCFKKVPGLSDCQLK